MSIFYILTLGDGEILYVFHYEIRSFGRTLGNDVVQCCRDYIIQDKGRALFFAEVADLHIMYLQVLYMSYKESVSGHIAKTIGLRIVFFKLRYFPCVHFRGASSFIINADIAHLKVFYLVSRQTADDSTMTGVRIVDDDIRG